MTDIPDDAAPAAPSAHLRPAYDPLSIALHWITVLLVLAQFATALAIDRIDPTWVKTVLGVHRSTGVLLWGLVAFRLAWRFSGMRLPPFPPTMARWHIAGVHLSEYGLYALLLVQPLTGMADALYHGRPFALFGRQIPALVERNRDLAGLAHTAHMFGAYTLAAVIGLHATAALFHHWVLKDGVLRSMLPWLRET